MLFGAHVSAAGGLIPAIGRAEQMGAQVIQVHTQSPRVWRPNDYSDELLESFKAAVAAHKRVAAVVCHASYLINLGTSDPLLLEKSSACLVKKLEVATKMGAECLVLHAGSHLGSGFEAVLEAVARQLCRSLDEAAESLGRPPCRLLLENTAGAGGTIGRSFEELASLLGACGSDERLGICLDTQHLYASGESFETIEEADRVIERFDEVLGLEQLGLIHLNDSKVPLGTNRDRHENLGQGFIGGKALGSLLSHPALQHLKVVLEVPGKERQGPAAEDLATARRLHSAGKRRRRAALART